MEDELNHDINLWCSRAAHNWFRRLSTVSLLFLRKAADGLYFILEPFKGRRKDYRHKFDNDSLTKAVNGSKSCVSVIFSHSSNRLRLKIQTPCVHS